MRGAGRDVWVKICASEAERAEWHAKARSAGLTLSDLVRRSVGRVRTWTVAHAEVERERTRQVARIGNNLNQIVRWASWCSMKSGRKPSTSSRMVRAIARKPCGVIRSGGMSKARNVLSSQTCRLIIGDSGERVSMGQASGLPGSLDRARTAHRLQSCSAIPATRPTAVRGRSPMNTSSTLSVTLVHPSAYYAT